MTHAQRKESAQDRVQEILAFPESERLTAWYARALREREAEQGNPPVLMCACNDIMTCEHPYPAIADLTIP